MARIDLEEYFNKKVFLSTAENNKELTDDSVKHNIARLQELGLLRREGGRKNGSWVVNK